MWSTELFPHGYSPVEVIDTTTNAVIDTSLVPDSATGIAFSRTNLSVYVACYYPSVLSVVDRTTDRVTGSPPKPLPGFAGYRPGIASLAPQAIGAETALPGSHDNHSHVQRPIRRGSIRARSWNKNAFHGLRRHPTGSAPSWPPEDGFCLTTLAQASLTLQTARSLPPASHPTSRSRTGASLPGTQASPRTGLTPAGHRETCRSYVIRSSISS